MVEKIGGRKAAACLTGLIVIVGCYLLTKSIPNELIEAVKYLVTTYLAGNIASDVVVGVNAKLQSAAAVEHPVVNLEPINQRIANIENIVKVQDQTLQQVVAIISKNA
jgi:ascorbate-specific PTS system EIIC-type component UlaA